MCTLIPASRAGVNQVVWSLGLYSPPSAEKGAHAAPPAPPGDYTFTLHAGGKAYVQKARLISRAPVDTSGGRETPRAVH